MENSRLYY